MNNLIKKLMALFLLLISFYCSSQVYYESFTSTEFIIGDGKIFLMYGIDTIETTILYNHVSDAIYGWNKNKGIVDMVSMSDIDFLIGIADDGYITLLMPMDITGKRKFYEPLVLGRIQFIRKIDGHKFMSGNYATVKYVNYLVIGDMFYTIPDKYTIKNDILPHLSKYIDGVEKKYKELCNKCDKRIKTNESNKTKALYDLLVWSNKQLDELYVEKLIEKKKNFVENNFERIKKN